MTYDDGRRLSEWAILQLTSYPTHMFKRLLLLLALVAVVCTSDAASAQTRVNGYYRANGTYVAPHYRTAPDNNFYNNYTTSPNVNPYTGQRGTRVTPPVYSAPTYSYPTYTAPRPYAAPRRR